ncbi:MAG: ABC transporter ATP-binding protein [Acidobacteriota bacterium]
MILQIENLTKRYGRRAAVLDLNLTVHRGDIYGFLGPNGAGKSTTLRMITGLVFPTSGRIRLFGLDPIREKTKALARVGAIIEAPAFYENLSGWDNVRLIASLSGPVPRSRIVEALSIVDLLDRAYDPVSAYSHGMRQRLGIAQALLPDPEFLLLDEPTDGLDPAGIREIRNLLQKLRERGMTIVLSSHLLSEVEQICNRVAILNEGRLLFEGTPGELQQRERRFRVRVDDVEGATRFVRALDYARFLGNGGGALRVEISQTDLARLNRALITAGFEVSGLETEESDLEAAFIRLTGGTQG